MIAQETIIRSGFVFGGIMLAVFGVTLVLDGIGDADEPLAAGGLVFIIGGLVIAISGATWGGLG